MYSICILLRVRTRFRTSMLWGYYAAVMEGYFSRFSPVIEYSGKQQKKQEEQEIFPKIENVQRVKYQERLAFTYPRVFDGKMWRIIWKKKMRKKGKDISAW